MSKFRVITVLAMMVIGIFLGGMLPMQGGPVAAQEADAAKDESFSMLNALWFKEDGGAEKYAEYIAAASPFVVKHGGTAGESYVPTQAMIGEFDADLVFFVDWPNEKAFLGLIQDPGYQEISHFRGEAITDSFLIRCKKQ
ncbi:MAG: hypothetical protein VCD00_07190 [Candidatus Hydrogenedentota bacterium]